MKVSEIKQLLYFAISKQKITCKFYSTSIANDLNPWQNNKDTTVICQQVDHFSNMMGQKHIQHAAGTFGWK